MRGGVELKGKIVRLIAGCNAAGEGRSGDAHAAEFKTIWVDDSQICTWRPTGRDIHGRTPVRAIKAHSSAEVLSPQDV